MAVGHPPGEHVNQLHSRMLKRCVGLRVSRQGNQIGLDCNVTRKRVAEQFVAVPALVPRRSITTPAPRRTKEQSRFVPETVNRAAMGIFSAVAIASTVVRDGDICPVSILDNIPVEIFAAPARSAPVSPRRPRSLRISRPRRSSTVVGASTGAFEPVAKAAGDDLALAAFALRLAAVGRFLDHALL